MPESSADHYRGDAIDIPAVPASARLASEWWRWPPPRRVVLWGARPGDIQFGSPEDRKQESWRRTLACGVQNTFGGHVHIAVWHGD